MNTEKYNGWENFITWKINLEFFMNEYYYELARDEYNNNLKDKVENIKDMAKTLKDDIGYYIENECENTTLAGWLESYINDVNFIEIARGLLDN